VKRFILTILILTLLAFSVQAAENQSIIFSGSYSYNNVATDADSAWLYIFNYGTLVDSTKVTAEDLQWDGYYQHTHACTNDSTDGWSGIWTFFDESEVVQINEVATVATARDSSYALEASITALRDTAQYLITSDGDTNQFTVEDIGDTVRAIVGDSIPALMDSLLLKARHAQVDSLKDTIENMSTRLLATGFSTFDPNADPVMVDEIKANVFGDTTLQDNATEYQADTTGLMHEADTAGLPASVYAEFIDGSNEDEFKATGFSTIDSTFLSSFMKRLIFGLPQGSGGDSTTLAQRLVTASGLASGDTNKYSLADIIAVIAAAIGDSNVARYSKRVDYQSDGDTNQAQVLVAANLDSLEGAIKDVNKANFKANVSGLATDANIRTALGDSLYSERMDSVVNLLINVKGRVLDLVYYWGACDDCYYRLYPEGGLADKDSAIIIDPSLGADSLVGKVIYNHGTDIEVVDSAYFYRDDPW